MTYVNIHDGTTHTLAPPTLRVLPQTFEMVFSQYDQHPEYKSLGPDGNAWRVDTQALLRRYPVTASGFHVIGKETERGWEQADDISTLLPALIRYHRATNAAKELLRERLRHVPLDVIERVTGLSRHTIIRARSGRRVHARSLEMLVSAVRHF